jgi:hypothetical protein
MSLSFSEPASCTRSGGRKPPVACATRLQMETCISRGFRMSIQERSASVSRDSENALPLVGSLPGRHGTPGKLSHPRQPFIVLQAPKPATEGQSFSATEIAGWLLSYSQAHRLTHKGDLPARRKWRPSGAPRSRVHLVKACSSQTEILRDPKSRPHQRFCRASSKAMADCLFYRISPEAIVGLVGCNQPQ